MANSRNLYIFKHGSTIKYFLTPRSAAREMTARLPQLGLNEKLDLVSKIVSGLAKNSHYILGNRTTITISKLHE